MNKPTRMALFIVLATIGNLAVTLIFFLLLMVLYGLTLARVLPPTAGAIGTFVCFVLAVIGAGFAYKAALGWARKRYDLEALLGPSPKRPASRRD